MKVYKFGGASVKDAAGVRNLAEIVSQSKDDLVVVVSAMGKTTNALERVVNALYAKDLDAAQREWVDIRNNHCAVCDELGIALPDIFFTTIPMLSDTTKQNDYDYLYDQIVSYGEKWSTRIVADYLCSQSMAATWIDMTETLVTDTTYREANIYMDASRQRLEDATRGHHLCIVQGFIGGAPNGTCTTLGREGSDYTAAVVGNLLDAESVTIWKDVPGILNADPRLVADTVKIDYLSYSDAVELAYSGAQVIHPKTLRPLANKQIPLYVKPFSDPTAEGSVIGDALARPVEVPVYIWRKNQLLITMRAKDLGFLLEESLSDIFQTLHQHRLKVSMIQSSAITISVCVDQSRYTDDAIRELSERYRISWNEGLSLLTIRGTSPEIIQRETAGREILLSQTTRRTARYLMRC